MKLAPGRLIEEVADRDGREPFLHVFRLAKQHVSSRSGGILVPLSRNSCLRHFCRLK